MLKIKIHPVLIAALWIGSITWLYYAYQSFTAGNTGQTLFFLGLAAFMAWLAATGMAGNKDEKTSSGKDEDTADDRTR
ncbi:hypothetical protein [Alkalicoccus chagannorensis]|uniref:hypothetical protein n=1 Tax=Alkalicoccus chagannorensis TaxID=427072 RepID=UPI000400184B|nr:hypothetical protein [Alkalicoccus chagannorensis]